MVDGEGSNWLDKLIDGVVAVNTIKYQSKAAAATASQQLGDGGYYREGQPGVTPAGSGTILGLPSGAVILAGVALLAVVLVKS